VDSLKYSFLRVNSSIDSAVRIFSKKRYLERAAVKKGAAGAEKARARATNNSEFSARLKLKPRWIFGLAGLGIAGQAGRINPIAGS
jgi:hypothetical protein